MLIKFRDVSVLAIFKENFERSLTYVRILIVSAKFPPICVNALLLWEAQRPVYIIDTLDFELGRRFKIEKNIKSSQHQFSS